jgi:hypothetical protein
MMSLNCLSVHNQNQLFLIDTAQGWQNKSALTDCFNSEQIVLARHQSQVSILGKWRGSITGGAGVCFPSRG